MRPRPPKSPWGVRAAGLTAISVALLSTAVGCGGGAADGKSTAPAADAKPAAAPKAAAAPRARAGGRPLIEMETRADREAARAAAKAN